MKKGKGREDKDVDDHDDGMVRVLLLVILVTVVLEWHGRRKRRGAYKGVGERRTMCKTQELCGGGEEKGVKS